MFQATSAKCPCGKFNIVWEQTAHHVHALEVRLSRCHARSTDQTTISSCEKLSISLGIPYCADFTLTLNSINCACSQ
jgi:hypothetical protein